MSPKTLGALPKSPAKSPANTGRRSSSGTGLRPVLPFDLDDPDGSAVIDEDDEGPEMGPMPIERSTPFAAQGTGKGVDEVEVCNLSFAFTIAYTLTVHVWRIVDITMLYLGTLQFQKWYDYKAKETCDKPRIK